LDNANQRQSLDAEKSPVLGRAVGEAIWRVHQTFTLTWESVFVGGAERSPAYCILRWTCGAFERRAQKAVAGATGSYFTEANLSGHGDAGALSPSGSTISNDATLTFFNDKSNKKEFTITTSSVVYDHDGNAFQVMWVEGALSILPWEDGK